MHTSHITQSTRPTCVMRSTGASPWNLECVCAVLGFFLRILPACVLCAYIRKEERKKKEGGRGGEGVSMCYCARHIHTQTYRQTDKQTDTRTHARTPFCRGLFFSLLQCRALGCFSRQSLSAAWKREEG